MSDYTTKRNEADELRDQLNNRLDYISELEAERKDLTEKLREGTYMAHRCGKCGLRIIGRYKCCPNCGARMDEDV